MWIENSWYWLLWMSACSGVLLASVFKFYHWFSMVFSTVADD